MEKPGDVMCGLRATDAIGEQTRKQIGQTRPVCEIRGAGDPLVTKFIDDLNLARLRPFLDGFALSWEFVAFYLPFSAEPEV